MKIQFLGANGVVTGSKTLLTYNGHRILVDCGLFQGPKEIRDQNWAPFPDAKSIDAVILTHAHIDHSGFLPRLVKEGFRGRVYSTEATQDLCKIMLPDSAYLQEEDAFFANKTKYSHHDPALPLYTHEDAEKALKLFYALPWQKWTELYPGFSFRFIRAGHILGSSLAQISFQKENETKILTFSGDLGNGRSFIIHEPEYISETDYLVMEATYGDRVQDKTNPIEEIGEIIQKVIGRGGTLIIPAFAVGRTQEILYIIHQLEKNGRISKVPVYLDSPMAQNVTQLYLHHQDELKTEVKGDHVFSVLNPYQFHEVTSPDDSMLLCMNTDPKVVISAAGMLTGGRILHHLKAKLPDEKSGVLFVGYQAQGTKGLLLKNGLGQIRIHHQNVDVEAEIFSIESLSAHADSNDIIDWMRHLRRKPNQVYLNHGETNPLFALKYRIENELQFQVTIPGPGQEFILD